MVNQSHIGKEIVAIIDCPRKVFRLGDIRILLGYFKCECGLGLCDIGDMSPILYTRCNCGAIYNTSFNRLSYAISWMPLEEISISEAFTKQNLLIIAN